MWYKHPFFKYMTGAVLVLIALYLLGRMSYILYPIFQVISTLFFPIVIGGFFYYILRPLVELLAKGKYIPRALAVLIVFLILIGGIAFAGYSIGDIVKTQVAQLIERLPEDMGETAEQTENFINNNNFGLMEAEELKERFFTFARNLAESIGNNIMGILTAITSVATIMVVVPFVLFFFLKDGHKFLPLTLQAFPYKYREKARKVFTDIDDTLSKYIVGQMTVAFIDGVLIYIGYLIIGLDFALVLALFAIITGVIPLLGPPLGTLPAVLVALMEDPMLAVWVVVVVLIVQQLEGNLISPLVFRSRLKLHPLTVILLLVVAGSIYGLIGILIAVPLYCVIKVTFINFYTFYQERKAKELPPSI
ncbi:AI-2E family transporter [Bacillus lacus]|uniref:AI-2E family transporter n=1 Tax=Metabacillus lacus TaxID=1983721 RepID=A0A7X2IY29_9BACI|nr:AI-2E family transporter [Metabacillus lacus]